MKDLELRTFFDYRYQKNLLHQMVKMKLVKVGMVENQKIYI